MKRFISPFMVNTLIDANVLDCKNYEEAEIVDQLLHYNNETDINIELPYSVKSEIESPNTPADVKKRAVSLIYSCEVPLTDQEKQLSEKVRDILRGNALQGKHDADAFHLFEANKYGQYFITNDQRMLKKRKEFLGILNLDIVTPKEFLDICAQFHE